MPILLFDEPGQLLEAAIDILILWILVYVALRFLRGSRGLGILRGMLIILILVGLGGFAIKEILHIQLNVLSLVTITSLPYFFLSLVIVFQPEIRRGFTRLGENPLIRLLSHTAEEVTVFDAVAQAAEHMSRRRIGALLAVERTTGLRPVAERGIAINARLEPALLEAIFHPGGPLHDGGVIISGDRIVAASCVFPLTESVVAKELGTRHQAAIGLTEETDALALVVSEETGRVSIAVRGKLVEVRDLRQLEARLEELYAAPELIEAEEPH
ncbi:MAG: diadenylate cyclase CdaA [Planctomycetota bacterium]